MGDRKRSTESERRRRVRDAFFSGKQCEDCASTENLIVTSHDPDVTMKSAIWVWSEKTRSDFLNSFDWGVKCKTCLLLNVTHHHVQKMSDEQIAEMRRLWEEEKKNRKKGIRHLTQEGLAQKFGCSQRHVSMIVRGLRR